MDDNKTRLFRNHKLMDVDGALVLRGQKCSCGKYAFPVMERCPFCGGEDLEFIPLSMKGKIYGCNSIAVPVGKHYKPPVVCAYVDLPEGVRIFGQVCGEDKKAYPGMPVDIKTGPIYEDPDDTSVIGYYFIPGEEKEVQ